MKTAKRPARPTEWVPFNTAFARIKELVGSGNLAAADLHRALLDGQLRSMMRGFSPAGHERAVVLRVQFWRTVELHEGLRSGVRINSTNRKPWRGRWVFFVARADLDQHFQTPDQPKAAAARELSDVPRRRPGPATKYDWHAINAEIAARCIDPKTLQLKVPKNQSKLAKDVLAWYNEKHGVEPDVSEMRAAVRIICAKLNTLLPR